MLANAVEGEVVVEASDVLVLEVVLLVVVTVSMDGRPWLNDTGIRPVAAAAPPPVNATAAAAIAALVVKNLDIIFFFPSDCKANPLAALNA